MFDESYCMSYQGTKDYISEINRLKRVYANKIKIYLGVEKDFFSNYDATPFEYVIESVHYVKKSNRYIPVDKSAQVQVDAVNLNYGRDFLAFVEDYFFLVN